MRYLAHVIHFIAFFPASLCKHQLLEKDVGGNQQGMACHASGESLLKGDAGLKIAGDEEASPESCQVSKNMPVRLGTAA